MKKTNFLKKGLLTLGFIVCCAGMFVSCVEEEIVPSPEKSELIGDVVNIGNEGNGHNDNADGERGKDNDDVIDIDLNL